ncbi:Chitin synthase, class 2 [Bulinus truncatus]|nr:Chitin synthase, class 2 [Bulinus truncatus]
MPVKPARSDSRENGAVGCGALQAAGEALLALKVVPFLGPTLTTFTMALSLVIPVVWETRMSWKAQYSAGLKICYTCACLCLLTGLGIFIYLVYDHYHQHSFQVSHAVHLAVCLVIMNLAWLPWLLKATSNGGSIGTQINDGNIQVRHHDQNMLAELDTQTGWKTSIMFQVTKIMASFIFFFIFYFLDRDWPLEFDDKVLETFLEAWKVLQYIPAKTWWNFNLFLIGGVANYAIVSGFCYMNLHRIFMVPALLLSLTLSVIIFEIKELCGIQNDNIFFCSLRMFDKNTVLIVVSAVVLSVGHVLFLARQMQVQPDRFMISEDKILWIPALFSGAVETSLFLNCRQTISDVQSADEVKWPSKVYICTTMYREKASEMRNVLNSLAIVNVSQRQSGTIFESHVFVDAGIHEDILNAFSLQLISLLEGTLEIKLEDALKMKTPYGLKLQWNLPSNNIKKMKFTLHFKDSALVAQRKRWSQVMYISYILDFCKSQQEEENTYILMTDGDVNFTPHAIESLLDDISRNRTAGAVCGRTVPDSMGPVAWYQSFDYAVAHWLQKTAEHVLGSVLCASGCFSLFRCKALKDVLAKYSTPVENANDFLIKDQGEDRWLSTLLLQSGWRIRYCPDSVITTRCPSSFENLYRQRRRWMTSTLANSMFLSEEWKFISKFNNRTSFVLLLYQTLTSILTMISPGIIILISCGAFHDTVYIVAPVLFILGFFYGIKCLTTRHTVQIWISVIYTLGLVIFMCIVAYESAIQIIDFLSPPQYDELFRSSSYDSSSVHPFLSNISASHYNLTNKKNDKNYPDYPMPVYIYTPSIYLGLLLAVYVFAALIHPKELKCLIHIILYLVCLPSAYFLLPIYSICNLNDCSWGLREEVLKPTVKKKKQWCTKNCLPFLKRLFYCCFRIANADKKQIETATDFIINADKMFDEISQVEEKDKENKKNAIHTKVKPDNSKELKKKEKKKPLRPDPENKESTEVKSIDEDKSESPETEDSKENPQTSSESDFSTDSELTSELPLEEQIHWAQQILDKSQMISLENSDPVEFNFWKLLISSCLLPVDGVSPSKDKKKLARLTSLRNGWLIVMFLLNFLFAALAITSGFGSFLLVPDSIGIILLVILLLPTGIQFLAMVSFQIAYMSSKIARAGYSWNTRSHIKWSFHAKFPENNQQDNQDDQRATSDSVEAVSDSMEANEITQLI